MTPMFSIFTLAIKFDSLFLAIFQSFHLFVISIFDKLAPNEYRVFQNGWPHSKYPYLVNYLMDHNET